MKNKAFKKHIGQQDRSGWLISSKDSRRNIGKGKKGQGKKKGGKK